MDIKCITVLPDEARAFSEFMLPHILDDSDYDKYFYHIAIRNDSVVGMLVESGTEAYPEILSLGISRSLQKKGIASRLIAYAISEMRLRVQDEKIDIPNSITVRLATATGSLTVLRHLFEKFDFQTYAEGSYYRVPVDAIDGNPIIQDPKTITKTGKMISDGRILPLSMVSAALIHSFNARLAAEGSFPEIDTDILDEKLTHFGIKDGEIYSCILFEKQRGNEIYNLLLYQDGDMVLSSECGYLLTAAATAALSLPGRIGLMFWIGTENTAKMMAKIFPEADPVIEIVEMELPL